MESEILVNHAPMNEACRSAAHRAALRRKSAWRAGSLVCALLLFAGLVHLLGSARLDNWADASLLDVALVIAALVLGVFAIAFQEESVSESRERAQELRVLTTEELEALGALAEESPEVGEAVARWLSHGAILTWGDYRLCKAYTRAQANRQARDQVLRKLERAA